MEKATCDLAILGGGLAGCLIALAVRRARPECDILLIEEGETLGGNHIWSFFATDISAADRWLVAPLICRGWRGYDVRFPEHQRHLNSLYYSIESEQLDAVVRKRLPACSIRTGQRALAASASNVVLEDGVRIEAGGVIDARGIGNPRHLKCGWQKFVGRLLHLAEPHGLSHPVVMDATVEQHDGYRFVYCLPFGPADIFVEDTYYSDTPALDDAALDQRIDAYAAAQGWKVEGSSRRETGVLPVVTGGDFSGYWRSTGERTAKAGARAALFQPVTSYSLPDAVRLAAHIARLRDISGDALSEECFQYAHERWQEGSFYRMLAKMMFRAAEPEQRYRVLERFYTLPQPLIERFYAGQSTLYDKGRILSGKPPVPIGKAFGALLKH